MENIEKCKKLLNEYLTTSPIKLSSPKETSYIDNDIKKFLLNNGGEEYLVKNNGFQIGVICERVLVGFIIESKIFENSKRKFKLDYDFTAYGERVFKACPVEENN